MNAFSAAVRVALAGALDKAGADPAIEAIVVLGAGATFIAGADITEFGTAAEGSKTPPGRLVKIAAGL